MTKQTNWLLSFILLVIALSVLINLNFVSAALCKGGDGYYHDCNEFYYEGKYKVYDTETYYDKEKYRSYYEYRNRFSPHHYVYYYRWDHRYDEDDKRKYNRDEADAYVIYKKNRMSFEEREEFEERLEDEDDWKKKYSKIRVRENDKIYTDGYKRGYEEGYDYGDYSKDKSYSKSYYYEKDYGKNIREKPNQLIYKWTNRDKCTNQFKC
jgi:hypothetical protein